MATYSNLVTITAVNQSLSITSNGTSTANLVVPSNSKAIVRITCSASMPTGPISSVVASFSAPAPYGIVINSAISTNTTVSTTLENITLGPGTYVLTVSMSGANPGNGSALSRVLGIIETYTT